jgi:hypothetical protein
MMKPMARITPLKKNLEELLKAVRSSKIQLTPEYVLTVEEKSSAQA